MNLSLRKVWAIRLTSGGDDEMLYSAGRTFWSFENSALTGTDPSATTTPEPFSGWRPGNPNLSPSQIKHCVTWYVRGLDDVTAWRIRLLNGLGFTGYYQLVTSGDGTRPDIQEAVEQQNLPNDGATGVGPWDLYYAMLRDKTRSRSTTTSTARIGRAPVIRRAVDS